MYVLYLVTSSSCGITALLRHEGSVVLSAVESIFLFFLLGH